MVCGVWCVVCVCVHVVSDVCVCRDTCSLNFVSSLAHCLQEYSAVFAGAGTNPGEKTLEDKFFEKEVRSGFMFCLVYVCVCECVLCACMSVHRCCDETSNLVDLLRRWRSMCGHSCNSSTLASSIRTCVSKNRRDATLYGLQSALPKDTGQRSITTSQFSSLSLITGHQYSV